MENKIVYGIDPDSDKHGVAVYIDGKLTDLFMANTVELMAVCKKENVIFSIENVCANNFVYTRNNKSTKAAQATVGLAIGRCQQAQMELMRWLDHYQIPYILHKPTKSNWHDNRSLFEKCTGWEKQSNDDTRSAAYFGFLAINKV